MSYEVIEYEKKLIQSQSIDVIELSLLERNTVTRLQFFLHNKRNFIKSTMDKFQHLRIFILCLLIKIFQQYSLQNRKRYEFIKKFLYNLPFEKITKNYGLQKEQLHKLVAIKLRDIQIGFSAESYLINTFNSAPFFDQILNTAFQEKFSLKNQTIPLEAIERVFKEHFNIETVWNVENVQNQGPNQFFLWKSKDAVLRQSAINMTFIGQASEDLSVQSESNRESNKKVKRRSSKSVTLQSIALNQSKPPNQMQNMLRKERQLKNDGSKMVKFQYQCDRQEQCKNKKRSLWQILCCLSE